MYQINFEKPIHVYFIGIGGISMSGLAEILMAEGFRVSGSDSRKSDLTHTLEEKGIKVYYGQRSANITDDIDLIVYTSAIHIDNPEFVCMQEKQIPSLTRAQLLGQLMRNYKHSVAVSGTHGKTTTTSMISEILLQAGVNPTLSVGGILKSIGGNYRIGGNEYFVTEACEYTNSFLSLFPNISIILNIDADHLDFFKDLQDIRNSFHQFASLLPEDGVLIINADIENISEITDGLKCRVITFGLNSNCDYYASDITHDELAHASFTCHTPGHLDFPITLGVSGDHNCLNALAAIALAELFQIEQPQIQNALLKFGGTNRRFEYKGSIAGITVIDDYAHHPTEITATLSAARNYPHKTIWCVFQPHTYTRTKALMDDFAKALTLADKVVLANIYAARETDTLGISSETLQNAIQQLGTDCFFFPTFDEIENFLLENCTPKDLLITMGAGDVHKIGENLLGK